MKKHIYPILFGIWGLNFVIGGEAADEFRAPDPLGRTLVVKGTHTDVDTLGETEGNAVDNRSYKHTMSNNLSLPNHVHSAGGYTNPHKGADTTVASSGAGAGMAVLNVGPTTEAITGNSGNPTTLPGPGGTIGLVTGATRPTNGPAAIVCNMLVVAG